MEFNTGGHRRFIKADSFRGYRGRGVVVFEGLM